MHSRLTVAWAVFGLAGLALILCSRLSILLQLVAIPAWLFAMAREYPGGFFSGPPFDRIVLHPDGSAVALKRRGRQSLALGSGSLVLGKVVWLRFITEQDRRFSVLLTAADLSPQDWRRLNLFWRHGLNG